MNNLQFSIIIPVYNRPNEIHELLKTLTFQNYTKSFEIIIVEDGSTNTCKSIVAQFQSQLNVRYLCKENSGAGQSRNFGMQHATGNYFIILDSDVLLPKEYLQEVENALNANFTDAFGGADAAHKNFTSLQKAISYAMTSFLTTGGIRGKKKAVGKFQPRSFNMGISKKAFYATKGFSNMKYGEDIDLTFRLWKHGFETQFIANAFVYHKRRTNLKAFYKQTFNFGSARPILNSKYPSHAKLTYWFPSLFMIGFDFALIAAIFGYWQLLIFVIIYFVVIFIDALLQTKSIKVAFLAIIATYTQFLGYGIGFLKSKLNLIIGSVRLKT